MTRSRFSEEQIIRISKEHQAGLGAKELCRKLGNRVDRLHGVATLPETRL